MNQNVFRQLRVLLILSRVAHLPTIWSNCLAGWWLAGGGNAMKLPLLLLGVSALYIGGAFLNDAFDVDSDRQRHAERPIPSGAISLSAVWGWGLAWLCLGTLGLFAAGKTTGVLALALLLCIFVYSATHKVFTASPWLMGACRFWVYVIAGSAGAWGVTGWPIWCGVALALYMAGLGSLAQRESVRGPLPGWPLILLAAPIAFAMLMNSAEYRLSALWLALVLALWIAWCGRKIFSAAEANIGHMVSGLLAGIVLVDWLAVAPLCPRWLSFGFLILFGVTLGLRRLAPAA